MPPWAVFTVNKSVNGRVFPGLFHFFVSLPCVAFEVRALVSCLALCMQFNIYNDVWRLLRGVPRAFGRSLLMKRIKIILVGRELGPPL